MSLSCCQSWMSAPRVSCPVRLHCSSRNLLSSVKLGAKFRRGEGIGCLYKENAWNAALHSDNSANIHQPSCPRPRVESNRRTNTGTWCRCDATTRVFQRICYSCSTTIMKTVVTSIKGKNISSNENNNDNSEDISNNNQKRNEIMITIIAHCKW